MLTDFITENRDEVVARTRARAKERAAPHASDAAMERGIPLFIDQLVVRLRRAPSSNEAVIAVAATHGADMSREGFTIKQVVQGYGDVCQVVTELALEHLAPISTEDFRALNACLDTATTEAVSGFEAHRDVSRSAAGSERLGVLAHELRNHVSMAMLSYDLLQRGVVAVNGSTGGVLGRSLRSLHALIDRSLAEVRLEGGARNEERVSIHDFLEEVELVASFEADAHGIGLSVQNEGGLVEVDVDRQILAAAMGNLVRNACKFTRPSGRITIQSTVMDGRVLLAVADGCGGLPPGKAEALFKPFQQRGSDRSGLGQGLAMTLKAVEISHGLLRVENRPGIGCVFTIDLPLAAAGH